MQHFGLDPLRRRPVEWIFASELTYVLTPFPALSNESMKQGPVCARAHSIAWTLFYTNKRQQQRQNQNQNKTKQNTRKHPRGRNVTSFMVGLRRGKTVTYAKISLKMMNPRDLVENIKEKEKEEEETQFFCLSIGLYIVENPICSLGDGQHSVQD